MEVNEERASEKYQDQKSHVGWAVGTKNASREKRTKEDVVLFVLFLGILSVVGIVLVPLYCCHNSNCTKIGLLKSACINS